jgi:hypothetical protein
VGEVEKNVTSDQTVMTETIAVMTASAKRRYGSTYA